MIPEKFIMTEKDISDAESWQNKIFKEMIQEYLVQNGYIKSWTAIVDSYDSTTLTASVHLPNDTTNILTNIKNKSNQTLVLGDIVELHSRLSSLGSCYIAVKY